MGMVFGDKLQAMGASTDNTPHDSDGAVEKSGILLQIEKVSENSNGDLTWHVLNLEDVVGHLVVNSPSGNLTIAKQ